MFTFPVCHFGGSDPISLEFVANAEQGAGTNYSFTGVNFGTASADRILCVGIVGARTSVRTVSSCTIGGVSATVVAGQVGGPTQIHLAYAVVPSGTSGTVAVNWSGSMTLCGIVAYAVKNYTSPTPSVAENELAQLPLIVTVSPPANTAVIAHSLHYSASSGTTTWTGTAGVVEDYDDNVGTINHSSASKVFAAGASNVTVQSVPTGSNGTMADLMVIGWT